MRLLQESGQKKKKKRRGMGWAQGRTGNIAILREDKAENEQQERGKPEKVLHSNCALLWQSEFLPQNKFALSRLQSPVSPVPDCLNP